MAMAATNILSLTHILYKDDTTTMDHKQANLIQHIRTIRDTISHIHNKTHDAPNTRQHNAHTELILYSKIATIASSCSLHHELLHTFMEYEPFEKCTEKSNEAAQELIMRGCNPLPRRRCFTKRESGNPKPKDFSSDVAVSRLLTATSAVDLTLPQLINLARSHGAAPIRLGIDVAGGGGELAAEIGRLVFGATVVTTTLGPYNALAARRGVVPMYVPVQQRLPVQDGVLDLVRTGRAVNRWIPVIVLEFLFFDVGRVLRPGGLLWVDHFFCRSGDLETVYGPMIAQLGFRRIRWAVGNKTDSSGVKNGEVYLTALLQKPQAMAGGEGL